MSTTDDPDDAELTIEMLADAKAFGYQSIQVHCREPVAKTGGHTEVSFLALSHDVPRKGDEIWLEDSRMCEVTTVSFKVSKIRDASGHLRSTILVPTVAAIVVN